MPEAGQATCVILLCSDLMLISTAGGGVRQHGAAFRSVSTVPDAKAAVIEATESQQRVRIWVDLATPGLDLSDLAASLPANVLEQAVAYGPHVHRQKLDAARDAGFGHVVSRGAFSAGFLQYL